MDYTDWIGRSTDRSDSMAPEQLQRFEVMMGRDPSPVTNGSVLPPCAHWVYFTPTDLHSNLTGEKRTESENDDLLPPSDLPRQLWSGGSIQFKKPLTAGVPADKTSTVIAVEEQEGATGKCCYITLRHQVRTGGAIAIDEQQQLAFCEEPEQGAHPIRTKPLDIDPDWMKTIQPDHIQLFRFSALTFNPCRIHYDQAYAKDEKGYPGLVVQNPLLLLYLLNAFKSKADGKVLEKVQYKALGPVYLGEELTIAGKSTDNHVSELRICGADKKMAMKATINWIYSW